MSARDVARCPISSYGIRRANSSERGGSMNPDTHVDPRGRPLQPTQEEIDAWAAREHQRRAAWLAGPSPEEKLAWAARYRWRSALGLEESHLGPAPEDVGRWAAQEHQRREAWVAGPTEVEKEQWARAHRDRLHSRDPESPAPTDTDVESWAARERQRRQEWIAGPSDEEKHRWAERQARGFLDELAHLPVFDEVMRLGIFEADFSEAAHHVLRDAELAGKGALYLLSRAPLGVWSYFVRAGREFEQNLGPSSPRRRVRY